MYNDPASGTDYLEFVELYNAGNSAVDLTGWSFSQGITHTFLGNVMQPGDYLVVAFNADSFASVFGFTPIDQDAGGLSNSGEDIVLVDSTGVTIDSVNYDNGGGWPLGPAGQGSSLVLCEPTDSNAGPANWSASASFAGLWRGFPVYASPGDSNCVTSAVDTDPPVALSANMIGCNMIDIAFSEPVDPSAVAFTNYNGIDSVVAAVQSPTGHVITLSISPALPWGIYHTLVVSGVGDTAGNIMTSSASFDLVCNGTNADLVINEIMYNNPQPFNDQLEFIEILNNDDHPVAMGGLWFREGVTFAFPEMTLNPDEYVVVAENSSELDTVTGTTSFQWTGALGNNGEDIVLSNTMGADIDSVNYDNTGGWPTAPNGGGPSLVLCNPDADNAGPTNWEASSAFAGIHTPDSLSMDTIWASPGSLNCAGDTAYCDITGISQAQGVLQQICVGVTCHNSGNDNGYGDFSHLNGRINRGLTVPISFRPTAGGAPAGPFVYKVWLDFNQDFDFEDAGEMVFSTTVPSDSTVNGSMTIPVTALTGPTRLRIAMGDTVNGPCDDIAFGEVQDYTIIVSSLYCGSVGSSTVWLQNFCVNAVCLNSGDNGGYRFVPTAQSLVAGTTFNVTLDPGYPGAPTPVFWKIFLDLNRDGDYDDEAEMLFGAGPTAGQVTGQFTIPTSAINGGTRLHLQVSDSPITGACDPASGEVEEYAVQIIGGQSTRLGEFDNNATTPVHFTDELEVSLIPNPTNSVSYLHINQVENSEVLVQVTDMAGRLVFIEKADVKSSLAIPTNNWNNGIYHVAVKSETGMKVLRMVVTK